MESIQQGDKNSGTGRDGFSACISVCGRAEGEESDQAVKSTGLDGDGIYPKCRPAYETAFVFLEEGAGMDRVPPWAMKLVVSHEKKRAGDSRI